MVKMSRSSQADYMLHLILTGTLPVVSFGRAIREGYLEIFTDDVEKLTGRKARSVCELIEANVDLLKGVAS